MKKGLYLVYSTLNLEKPDGIEKKIISQRDMFENEGLNMRFSILEKNNGTFWNYKQEYSKVDFIYFRKSTVIDWRFCIFFRKIKLDNPNIKVFMEIPTYPYKGEFGKGLYAKGALFIDSVFKKHLKNIVDYIIVTGCDVGNRLWNIPALNVVNGIDVQKVQKRRFLKNGDEINISCIAKFSPWHGYERILRGLYEYYEKGGTRIVKIIMVGDGVEKSFYEEIVKEFKLNKYVTFTGKLIGDDLEDIYDKTDIGCCSLGRYKSGINVIGDLKSREFMAKGIPMICGCKIDVLQDEKYPYAIYFSNNKSSIDIARVLIFYDHLFETKTYKQISEEIIAKARELVDYSKTFAPVLNEVRKQIC